jgi:hypothetical protein
MNILAVLQRSWQRNRQSNVVLVFSIITVAIILIPIQHYVTLSRNQHYALAIATLGFGYLLQASLSWRNLSGWGRICHLTTGLFFASVAIVFAQNPWLDLKNGPLTDEQEMLRKLTVTSYAFLGLLISAMWLGLIFENAKAKGKIKTDQPNN